MDSEKNLSCEVSRSVAHPVALGVMSAFLRVGTHVDHASSVVLIGTFLFALKASSDITVIGLPIALLLALAEKYFAWRVALDAELFGLLRQFPNDMADFDSALATCIGRKNEIPARSMTSRWLGARRLLCRQASVFALQSACLITILML